MHFRVLPTVLICLGLIFLGVTGYFSVQRWMSTRIVYPLNMPISLAPGHIRTRPFQLNLRTDYFVIIAISDSWQWAQAHPECNPYRHLQTRWVLYREGNIVDRQDEPTTLPWPTSFEASPGIYQLDLEVLNDFRCVDPIDPRLEIIARTEHYESGAFAVKMAAIVAVYIGLCFLVFVPAVQTVGQRKTKTKIIDSATIDQNFQWARKLPLRRPIFGLPAFGLVGGIIFASLAMAMMLITIPMTPKGIWVHLLKPGAVPAKSDSWTPPLIVRVKYAGLGPKASVVVNSKQVRWDDLDRVLKEELSLRREWIVHVEGDACVDWMDVAAVIDGARSKQAKVVLVTGINGEKDCQK